MATKNHVTLDEKEYIVYNIDHKLKYKAYHHDFGPLDLSLMTEYINELNEMVRKHKLAKGNDPQKRKIMHHCSSQGKFAANSAVLIGAYMILELNSTAEAAFAKFKKFNSKFLPFNDSGVKATWFDLRVEDCLKAVEAAKLKAWYDHRSFDIQEYRKMDQLEEGDINWVVPKSLIAMSSPALHNAEGLPPSFFVPYFRAHNVTSVVRFNEKLYNDMDFEKHGIRIYPMEFVDGTCPSESTVVKFITICEHEIDQRRGVVAVHCRAGLGRTGTLIACYLMYKHGLAAKTAMGWVRLCRPGSIIGPQQQFLVDIQPKLLNLMKASRKKHEARPETNQERPYRHAAKKGGVVQAHEAKFVKGEFSKQMS